ncbi:MAG: CMD domain protein [Rubrivivax sp.]
MTDAARPDVIDTLVPLAPGSALHALRGQRDKVRAATQGSDEAIFDPALPGLSVGERLRAAQLVAELSGSAVLAAHYAARAAHAENADNAAHVAQEVAPESGPRMQAILTFARLLAVRPVEGDRAALLALPAAGLATPDVVTLAQLIAFVAYQLRVVAGLQALHQAEVGEPRAAALDASPAASAVSAASAASAAPDSAAPSAAFVHPAHLPAPGEPLELNGYTSRTLGWKAWLPLQDLATATPEQMEILRSSHPKATSSDYYLTLIQQPRILQERSMVFNAIMYAPGGLSRAERELASTVVSRVNGCVYCASVHAQRFEQLARRQDVLAQVFAEPEGAGTNARERAIVQAAIDLTREPAHFDASRLRALREAGLTSLEVLDLIHAIAIFAWANRLMLNLGEPV